jgi:PAS domain S-box-containing protein
MTILLLRERMVMADSNYTYDSGHIKVLYVDDDAAFIETTKLMLLDLNPTLLIESCTSVDEALTKLSANQYDAIISDYDMPLKNGLELLKTLREQDSKIPFILFTGKGREEVAIQALNLGADGYHNKQGSPETVYGELTHKLRTVVSYYQTRTSLSQSEEKFRKAFETIPDAVYVTALDDGEIIEINDGFVDMFGFSRSELIGKSTLDLGLWANSSDRQTIVDKIKEDGKLRDIIVYWHRKNGDIFPGLLSVSSLTVNQQELTLGVIKDVSVLQSNQESLRKSEARWAATLSSIGDAVIATDVNGNISFMNEVAEQLTGWPLDEAVNRPLPEIFRIVNETTRKTVENPVTKVLRTGLVVGLANHTILITKNGDEISIDDSGAPIMDENKKTSGVVLVFRDIGERRKMERQLSDSERKFRSLFNSMNEGAALHRIIYDSKGKAVDYEILEVNTAYEVFTGIKRREAVGQKASKLYGTNDPPYLEQYAKVAESGKNILFDTYFAPMKKHFQISVFSPENGKFASVFLEITERKKAEEDLASVNEKLRVIGSIVRHDVSNKLSSIRANAYLLRKNCADAVNPKINQYLSNIDADVKSAEHLFDLSRLYEQIGVERQGEINVERCFNEAVALSPKLHLSIINMTSGLEVTADSLLKQVFYNLIDNSVRHGQKVTEIKLSYKTLGSETVLTYQDNGVGIPLENKARLFTEGFSTGNGTGLGLAIIRRILQVYGWNISEVGVPGEGARFEINVPRETANP